MMSGKRINLTVLTAWMIGNYKLEASEKQGPLSLVRIQPFRTLNVFQVLIFSNYLEQVDSSFELMPPHFDGHFHR